jgi:hypothetical protein
LFSQNNLMEINSDFICPFGLDASISVRKSQLRLRLLGKGIYQ